MFKTLRLAPPATLPIIDSSDKDSKTRKVTGTVIRSTGLTETEISEIEDTFLDFRQSAMKIKSEEEREKSKKKKGRAEQGKPFDAFKAMANDTRQALNVRFGVTWHVIVGKAAGFDVVPTSMSEKMLEYKVGSHRFVCFQKAVNLAVEESGVSMWDNVMTSKFLIKFAYFVAFSIAAVWASLKMNCDTACNAKTIHDDPNSHWIIQYCAGRVYLIAPK